MGLKHLLFLAPTRSSRKASVGLCVRPVVLSQLTLVTLSSISTIQRGLKEFSEYRVKILNHTVRAQILRLVNLRLAETNENGGKVPKALSLTISRKLPLDPNICDK